MIGIRLSHSGLRSEKAFGDRNTNFSLGFAIGDGVHVIGEQGFLLARR
jgi:hypothetical protein